jgi:hypothetical protein
MPISLNKYARFLRKIPKHFFPDKNLLGFYSNYMSRDFSLFGTELYHRTSSGFRDFVSQNQFYDKKQIIGPVEKAYILEILNKFINFPAVPKTYIKRKHSNYYEYMSQTSTFAVASINLPELEKASADKTLIERLTNAMSSYSTYLSAFERGYYFSRPTSDIMKDVFYFFKDDDNDLTNLLSLLNQIPDNLPFLVSLNRANSVVSLKEKNFLDETHYFDPIRWKDNFRDSKFFYDKVLKHASKNAVLAQTAIVIKLQTINYDLLSYHATKIQNNYKQIDPNFVTNYKDYWMNTIFSSENKQNNTIMLKYFFYELIDYEEYI